MPEWHFAAGMPTTWQASVLAGWGSGGDEVFGSLDDLQCMTALVQRTGASIWVIEKKKKKKPAADGYYLAYK